LPHAALWVASRRSTQGAGSAQFGASNGSRFNPFRRYLA